MFSVCLLSEPTSPCSSGCTACRPRLTSMPRLPCTISTAAIEEEEDDDLAYEFRATSLDSAPTPRPLRLGDYLQARPEAPAELWPCAGLRPPSSAEEWPRLESNPPSLPRRNAVASREAWLGGESTIDAVGRAPPSPIGWAQPSPSGLPRRGAFPLQRRGRRPPPRPPPRGLKSALRQQDWAIQLATKLRGSTRRAIGKHSRNEAFERSRRLAPAALCGAAEAAARPGRHAEQDALLAHAFGEGLSLRGPSARELCAGGMRPDCIEATTTV